MSRKGCQPASLHQFGDCFASECKLDIGPYLIAGSWRHHHREDYNLFSLDDQKFKMTEGRLQALLTRVVVPYYSYRPNFCTPHC